MDGPEPVELVVLVQGLLDPIGIERMPPFTPECFETQLETSRMVDQAVAEFAVAQHEAQEPEIKESWPAMTSFARVPRSGEKSDVPAPLGAGTADVWFRRNRAWKLPTCATRGCR